MQSKARSDLQAALAQPPLDDQAIRLKFCLLCVQRVAHLLERDEAKDALAAFHDSVSANAGYAQLPALALQAGALARNHAGSGSIDGTGHASVSATHALARAIAGDALGAADYAAYAATYSYGGYAVQDAHALDPEYIWQLQALRDLIGT